MTRPIVVIGAGIVGVASAIWLQRFGHRVILLDKGQPGMGASFGNAGLLAQWAVVPVTTPSLWKDAPSYVLNPNSPLFLKWGYLPRLAPWLAKFMLQATDKKARQTVGKIAPLLTDAVDQHRSLARDTSVEKWIADSKFSFVYQNRAAFEADSYSWELKRSAGFVPKLITGQAVSEEEPILGPASQCLAIIENQGHILNPLQYIKELVAYFESEGGTFQSAEVTGIEKIGGRVSTVLTTTGRIDCSHAVVTSGIWSKELMKTLGLKVPLETERGYHVLFESPSEMPKNPMMITKGKFGVNPMETGLRCAGTVELGDHHAEPSKAPIRLLYKYAKEVFPNLKYSGTSEWMGFRPSTPDSLPLIGEIGDTGIFTGFGHQHVGLTAGPKTGRLIAQMISGQNPNVDLSPYAPARYLS